MQEFSYLELRNQIADIAQGVDALAKYSFMRAPVDDFRRVFDEKRHESRLHVAVCGAYSSGKSTLISCLTGRKDIKIGQGIVTDKATEYEYDDWTIVDTPGICAGRPEHDETSLKYMERADLLIYMIPSKGFTPEVEKNFKKTIMARYGEKTMLVMGRISDVEVSNLPAKRQDVIEVLGDEGLLEKFRFCMLDVQDYMIGVEEKDEELKAISRMDDFKRALNDFVLKRGACGKCLALLDVIDGFANAATEICESKAACDEVANRQMKAVRNAMTRYRRSFLDAKMRMRNFVSNERSEMLSLLGEGSAALKEKMETLPDRLEKAADDQVFMAEQEAIFSDLKGELSDINEQVVRLNKRVADACGGLPSDGASFDLEKWKIGMGKFGNVLSGMSKDTLIKIVHFFGGKFKPWGATKWLNCLKGVGKALPVVAEVIGTGADLYAEKKFNDAREELTGSFSELDRMVCEFYDGCETTEPYQKLKSIEERLVQLETARIEMNAQKDDVLAELVKIKRAVGENRSRLCG